MSTSTEGLPIPPWDLADRLRKSLRISGVGVQEMADYLDVSRNTVSAWVNGRTPPSTQSIRLWALRTGFPYEWLRDGTEPASSPPDPLNGGERSHLGESNPRPIHYLRTRTARIPHLCDALDRTG
jgi:transcriptional regulator with XRE-family HTH domain